MSLDKLKHLDLYALLGVSVEATSSQIKSAYRKKSRLLHPDKNPDVDKAVAEAQFAQLADAAKLLQDEQLRKAYDQILKAREAHAIRLRKLDSKRRRLRDDLRAKEEQSVNNDYERLSEEEKRRRRVEELRREGAKLLEEEHERRQEAFKQDQVNNMSATTTKEEVSIGPNKLKAKWKKNGEDQDYDEALLRRLFHKYGEVRHVIALPSSALIEFEDEQAAKMAADFEKGLPNNPLVIKLIKK